MTNPFNFFAVPAALSASAVVCKSGNSYTPVNSLLENVATGDILDVINMGCRQIGGQDSGAQLPLVAGRFYNPAEGATPGTLQLAASTIYAFPFRIPGNLPVQTLNMDVTTAGMAGTTLRFALYQDLAGAPSTQIAGTESGSQVGTSTGALTFTPAAPLTLQEGWYWGAVACNGTATPPTVAAIAAGYAASLNNALGQDTLAHAIATSAEAAMGVTASFVFGSLPASFPTASYALVLNAAVPLIVLGT